MNSPHSSPVEYNTATIRKLLTEAFTDEEFTIFCYDHFRPVYRNFSGLTFRVKIQLLIEHCEKNSLFEALLPLVKEFNPQKYLELSEDLQKSVRPTPSQSQPTSDPQPITPDPRSPQRILVVEDDPIWQKILQECLIGADYLVEFATTFDEARQSLQKTQFDLVTLDARLQRPMETPEGILLLDYIRNRLNISIPIIVISGEINRRDLVRAFKQFSVSNVLLKENFDYSEFSAAVRDAFEH